MDNDIRLPTVGYANGYWWVRAGSIEILKLCGIEFINKAIYEPIQAKMWVGIKVDLTLLGSVGAGLC
jgi:hypothetical protein